MQKNMVGFKVFVMVGITLLILNYGIFLRPLKNENVVLANENEEATFLVLHVCPVEILVAEVELLKVITQITSMYIDTNGELNNEITYQRKLDKVFNCYIALVTQEEELNGSLKTMYSREVVEIAINDFMDLYGNADYAKNLTNVIDWYSLVLTESFIKTSVNNYGVN